MYEDVCYKQNFLKEVVCRLDFASPIVTLRNSMPKEIFEVVRNFYPIAEPHDMIGTELTINPLNGPTINQVATKQWLFLSRDRKNKCTIESSSVVFSINNYNVFEEAKNSFIDILRAVMSTFPTNQGKRLGLRYVNVFPLKGHENWINNKFYGAISEHKVESTIKLLTSIEYAVIEKDLAVMLNYGYYNPDYPSIMRKEDFIIDIDSYSTGIIYEDDLEQFVEDMHSEVQKCFENLITDEFRTEMNS